MKFLALERERSVETKFDLAPFLHAEARRVWELYLSATIREIYFRADQPTAVLVLECEDEEEAQASLASLPLVQAGLIEFEILPLIPYPGFSRLFAPGSG